MQEKFSEVMTWVLYLAWAAGWRPYSRELTSKHQEIHDVQKYTKVAMVNCEIHILSMAKHHETQNSWELCWISWCPSHHAYELGINLYFVCTWFIIQKSINGLSGLYYTEAVSVLWVHNSPKGTVSYYKFTTSML